MGLFSLTANGNVVRCQNSATDAGVSTIWAKHNTVQKVAGTVHVPSDEPPKAIRFEGYGT